MSRRIIAIVVFVAFVVGLGATTPAAADQICPYVKAFGEQYEVCVPLP